jgi:hypothetical protein
MHKSLGIEYMRTCESCGRIRFYLLNFIFSKSVCNECHMLMREKEESKKKYTGMT